MTYEVQVGDATEVRELPFVIGVLADLEGHSAAVARLKDKQFLRLSADNFDQIMQRISPVLGFSVPSKLSQGGENLRVDLRFRALFDFEPAAVAAQIPSLRSLLDLRQQLDDLRSAIHANDRLDRMIQNILLSNAGERDPQRWELEIESVLDLGLTGRLEEEKNRAREWLRAFFGLVSAGETIASPDTEAVVTERIGFLDELISLQLNEVFHHPEFQRLEASWRGLHYLVTRGHESAMLHIEVLHVSKRDMLRDVERAPEFDQSVLFKRVYDDRYGTYGGFPFSVLIADYEFDRSPRDVYLLQQLSYIAGSASAPVIAAAASGLFGFDSFTDLSRPRDLAKIFDSTEYVHWKAFRAIEESRYVALVMPRVLMRLPYGRAGIAAEGFNFDERVDVTEHQLYLWGTAVWAFALRLADAFHRYGWCAAVTGPERGGTVADLPVHEFTSDEGDVVAKCPTEIAITDRRRGELEKLGFVPLCYRLGSDIATFFEAPSCNKPRVYLSDLENEVAHTAAKLEYTLVGSRISHYLRSILRDREGTFLTRAEWEVYLKSWLNRYVLLDDEAPEEIKARYPLRAAAIEMTEVPGKPGKYSALVRIIPHFQLDGQRLDLPVTLEIVARI
jgi:type VI secretion system protein ImpC